MSAPSLSKRLRRLIPFPKRKTLRRWFPSFETRQLVWLMNRYDIAHVVDIGANQGQFVEKLRSARWNGPVVSFEPQAAEHTLLTQKAANDPHWRVAPRLALGDKEGTVTLNRFADSSVSSILAPTSSLQKHMPSRGTEEVPLTTFDRIAGDYLSDRPTLLKLDVQGFEPFVLRGAEASLPKFTAIFIEVSLLPMYEGDTHYLDMLDYLHRQGFHAVHISPVLNRRRFGESGQLDVFLVRQPSGQIPRRSVEQA